MLTYIDDPKAWMRYRPILKIIDERHVITPSCLKTELDKTNLKINEKSISTRHFFCILKELERGGYIERKPINNRDRHPMKIVYLTDHGRKVLAYNDLQEACGFTTAWFFCWIFTELFVRGSLWMS